MDKNTFQQKLQNFMVQRAGTMTERRDVEEFFREEHLSEDQIAMIMDYVSEKREENSLSREEQEYLEDYLASLDGTGGEQSEERYWLSYVAGEAVKYHSKELALEDLIQEGNLGLILGLQEAVGANNPEEVIKKCISRELSRASERSASWQAADRSMVEKVRALDESLTKLEKELGRKVYPEEIAADMGISEENVRDIIKLTGEDTGEEGGTTDAGTEGN
ncbi:MAG: sigma-70 domain-containing protein [Ruminococcus sp.]|jgi:RNA polymerase primary sigma factor